MKKELPHYSAMLVFHFFYCREKKKGSFVINIVFFVLISTHKRQ